jgi:CheY-like chemotaxis protein
MGPAQPKRQTVLIVEDDGELRRLMVTLLEDEHLDAIECESAEAALAMMRPKSGGALHESAGRLMEASGGL